jgi:magnesium transporter
MANEGKKETTLAESLHAALRVPLASGGDLAMTACLRGKHPADIAEAMTTLSNPESLAVFNWLDNERAASVLPELEPDTRRYLIDNAPAGRIADLLDLLPMDDAADVVAEAAEDDPEQAEELLGELAERAPEDAAEVRELLDYEENTAGRLMTDNFVRLLPDMTVEEAFAAVRSADPEVETLTELYVVDKIDPGHFARPQQDEHLLGVIPLRLLVNARPDQRVRDIMIGEPLTVSVDADQEEVARIFSKYSFLAVPVLDRRGFLAGIITMDDILHVLQEEQSEDMLALGAVAPTDVETPYLSLGVIHTVKQRFGWLLLLFVASMFTGTVSRHFEGLVGKLAVLSTFIPLLIGTGGNAGSQAVMTVTRALALGEVNFRDWLRVLWRETRTGLLLGSVLALVGYFFVLIGWRESAALSLVIALSLTTIVLWASIVGSLLPLAAKRLGFDPAVMSAPFISTFVDATGLFFYFTIARMVLPQLRN